MFRGNEYYTLLDGYMIHNSIGSEIHIYQCVKSGYFFLVEDLDDRYMYAPTKRDLDRFELGEEFNEDILAHVLKYG